MTKSFPTELNPWYVIWCFKSAGHLGETYYMKADDGSGMDLWDENPKKCQIHLTLRAAIRSAKAVQGEILVLYSREQLPDYGREIH